jgi:DNA-binding MarR family transcriptional regulator
MTGTGHPDRAAAAAFSRVAPATPEAIFLLMRDASRALLGLLADCAAAAGLNQNDYLALLRIVTAEGISPAELRRILGISAGSMTELADRLQGRGLVSRVRPPGDRRRIELKATGKGLRTADQTIGPVVVRLQRIASELDSKQLVTVDRFLRAVALAIGNPA